MHPGDGLIGHGVDFLQFRYSFLSPVFPGGYFPSFNVADSAITLGAICLILEVILRVCHGRQSGPTPTGARACSGSCTPMLATL